MKMLFGITMILLAIGSLTEARPQGFWDSLMGSIGNGFDFVRGAAQGTGDMGRAYLDMRDANWQNSDKYFHSRGNYDAAQRGDGGRWAAEVISNGREWVDQLRGGSPADSASDQAANEWGRNGGDPNVYRPEGLPDQY